MKMDLYYCKKLIIKIFVKIKNTYQLEMPPKKPAKKKVVNRKRHKAGCQNPWIKFLKQHGCENRTRAELQAMYHASGQSKSSMSQKALAERSVLPSFFDRVQVPTEPFVFSTPSLNPVVGFGLSGGMRSGGMYSGGVCPPGMRRRYKCRK